MYHSWGNSASLSHGHEKLVVRNLLIPLGPISHSTLLVCLLAIGFLKEQFLDIILWNKITLKAGFHSVEFSERTGFYTIKSLSRVKFYSNSKRYFLTYTKDFQSVRKIRLSGNQPYGPLHMLDSLWSGWFPCWVATLGRFLPKLWFRADNKFGLSTKNSRRPSY